MAFDPSMFSNGIASDLKGALAGGAVTAILDQGTFWRRLRNGVGGVAIAIAMTPTTVVIVTALVGSSEEVRIAVSAIWAIVGLIIADALQRVARRVAGKSDEIGDAVVGDIIKKTQELVDKKP
jgi:hypothetical protein